MATPDLDLVRRAYEAFARRDIDTLIELSDPEVEFTSLIRESEGVTYRGHEGLREYLESLVDVLPDWRPIMEDAEVHGDQVLVRLRIHATPPGGDVPIEQQIWQVLRFRDGLSIRWDFFRTETEARGALAG